MTTAVPLCRITVSAPGRRLDVALPAEVPVAELLPELVRRAGPLPEEQHGWQLRRLDGTSLTAGRHLHGQDVRDGDVLCLVPAELDWPPPRYDDVPAAVAAAAARRGAAWTPAATAVTIRVATALLLAGGLLLAIGVGEGWLPATVAAALLISGVLGSRRGHRVDGALLITFAAGYAAVAGYQAGTAAAWGYGDVSPMLAALAGTAVGLVGAHLRGGRPADRPAVAGDGGWLPVAAVTTGVCGMLTAPVALTPWGWTGVAAVGGCLVVCAVPAAAPVALRLARLPAAPVGAGQAFPAVARADELLTGIVAGAGVFAVAVVAVLLATDTVAAWVLAVLVSAAMVLRAGTFVAVRHRSPLLVAGLLGLAAGALAAGRQLLLVGGPWPAAVLVVLCAAAAAVALRPAPRGRADPGRWRRAREIAETVVVVAVVPIAAWALDLFARLASVV